MYNLGQYLPRSSALQRCDPRIKIAGLLCFSILIIRLNTMGLGLVFLLILGMAALGRITWGDLLEASRPTRTLFLVLFIVYLFWTPGTPLLPLFGDKWYISHEGLSMGILMVGRFWLLILAAAILTMTTSQSELAFGLQRLLAPLKVAGISSYNIAMMVSLAVRFVPTLQMEMDQVREAQAARGADLKSTRSKFRALKYTAIPLTMNVIRRSEELIEAMESRGYNPGPRTYLYEPQLTRADFIGLALLILLFAAVWSLRGVILI